MGTTELHIFKNCESYFSKKVHDFHDEYVDSFLLIGIADPDSSLDEVKMTKNPQYSSLYHQRIVGGVMSVPPLIVCESFNQGKISASCSIFYLNNYQDIEDFYMIQKVHNWQNQNLCSHQVWRLFQNNIFDMNNHWL